MSDQNEIESNGVAVEHILDDNIFSTRERKELTEQSCALTFLLREVRSPLIVFERRTALRIHQLFPNRKQHKSVAVPRLIPQQILSPSIENSSNENNFSTRRLGTESLQVTKSQSGWRSDTHLICHIMRETFHDKRMEQEEKA